MPTGIGHLVARAPRASSGLVQIECVDRSELGRAGGGFQAVRVRAQAAGHPVMEHAGEVTFVERVSMFDEDLAARAVRLSCAFGSPQPWFDGIRTYAASGIWARGPRFAVATARRFRGQSRRVRAI